MSQSADDYKVSGLAITLSLVTAALMITTGLIAAFYGGWELLFGGVERDTDTIIDLSARTWGAVHFGLGVAITAAGGALLSGKAWARVIAIIMSAFMLLAGIGALPDSPVFSLFLIVFNAAVLWALLFHGHDVEEVTG
jgi:hypothetical protein